MKKKTLGTITVCVIAMLMPICVGCNQKNKTQTQASWQQDPETGKWGYIDYKGTLTIPYRYDSITNIRTADWHFFNLLAVCIDGKWGVVNEKTGKEVVACKYNFFDKSDSNSDLLSVNIGGKRTERGSIVGGKWGLIDKNGNEITPCIYNYVGVRSAKDSLLEVTIGEERGVVHFNGTVVEPLEKYAQVRYSGKETKDNQTVETSFVLVTHGKKKRIEYFSFNVKQELGTGKGALDRSKSFNVNTTAAFDVFANGILQQEKFTVVLAQEKAVCSIENNGQHYTCTAYPEKGQE